jgi:hypothetical protein
LNLFEILCDWLCLHIGKLYVDDPVSLGLQSIQEDMVRLLLDRPNCEMIVQGTNYH